MCTDSIVEASDHEFIPGHIAWFNDQYLGIAMLFVEFD